MLLVHALTTPSPHRRFKAACGRIAGQDSGSAGAGCAVTRKSVRLPSIGLVFVAFCKFDSVLATDRTPIQVEITWQMAYT